jgi:hypothetical protein
MKGSTLVWVSIALFASICFIIRAIDVWPTMEEEDKIAIIGIIIVLQAYGMLAVALYYIEYGPKFWMWLSIPYVGYRLVKLINKYADKYLSTE